MRIDNRGIPAQVAELSEFRTKHQSVFAHNNGDKYVVYSYGYHWPIAVYDRAARMWYVNDDKYSVTTSRHASLVRLGVAMHMQRHGESTIREQSVGQLEIQQYING